MNKNAFEIRLDVLKIAQEMLTKNFQTEENRFWLMNENRVKGGLDSTTAETLRGRMPLIPMASDVTALATTLYSFVSPNERPERQNNVKIEYPK